MLFTLYFCMIFKFISLFWRADYWKSQTRKFCDYCKCWLADNKPSIEFHENGKKHKENVEKKLKEIRKKSIKESKQQQKFDDDIKKMENVPNFLYKRHFLLHIVFCKFKITFLIFYRLPWLLISKTSKTTGRIWQQKI